MYFTDEKDYIMRMIKEMVRVLFSLMFGKKYVSVELEKENKLIPQLALACDDNTRNILLDNIYFY